MTGVALRLARLLPGGRAVFVALDHTAAWPGRLAGLADPAAVLTAAADGGANAILAPLGTIQRFPSLAARLGVIASVSDADSVDTAQRVGADAVKVMHYPATPEQDINAQVVAAVIARAHHLAMPVLVETVPGGFGSDACRDTETIAATSRMAVEAGAAMIKTFLPTDVDEAREVAAYVGIPMLAIGGDNADASTAALAVRAGWAGVAVGRGVWGRTDRQAAVREYVSAVHGGMR